MRNLAKLAAVAGMLLAPGAAQAIVITPAVQYTSTNTLFDFLPYTAGYTFSLSAPVTVNALGYWDDGRANNHQVGIWDSSSALIASTTVMGTDLLVGNFRWGAIASLTLNAGQYTIGGEYLGNSDTFPNQATGVTTIPEYTWGVDKQLFGAGLNLPTSGPFGYGQNGILVANFSVGSNDGSNDVPEPITLSLLGAGLAGIGMARRRRG